MINIDPPLYLYSVIPIMILVHYLIPLAKFIYYPFTLLGIIPLLFGIIINLAADSLFKKFNTTVKPLLEPKELITSGIFTLTRNPMYLGFTSILFGISIMLGSILPFIITIVFIGLLDVVFIRFEEKNLENIFGNNWLIYKNKVRRWI